MLQTVPPTSQEAERVFSSSTYLCCIGGDLGGAGGAIAPPIILGIAACATMGGDFGGQWGLSPPNNFKDRR